MSAKADAEAAAALRELGATLKASTNAPKLHTLKVLHGLGLDEEEDELELSMMEELATLVKNADGPAGDQVKYEHAVGSMVKRWKLFVALYDLGEQAPTLEMVKLFVGFMYTYRQRASKTGRQGLGDCMAEMAQYILAQVGSLIANDSHAWLLMIWLLRATDGHSLCMRRSARRCPRAIRGHHRVITG
jgi:hypothetical protein